MKEKKDQERKDYEIRAEIIVKKLLSRIYNMEAKALEARLNAEGGMKEVDEKLESLKKQREELEHKFSELKQAGKDKWESLMADFEEFLAYVDADKQEFYEKVELWIQEATEKIDDLEEKANHASEDLKVKINDQVEQIKKYKQSLEVKFADLKKTQDGNWQKMKEGLEEGLTVVKDSINKAFDYMRK
jgi:predicted  nucleic acid-binding Zn-ribbon protein